jgi:capsular exopolysaccharide synthesis family protein
MEFNFGGAAAALKRNRYLVLAIVTLTMLVAVLITLRSERLFRATATVQIEQQTAKVLSSDEEQPAMAQEADRFLQTQISLLNSRAMAKLVANQLKLVVQNDNSDSSPSSEQSGTAVINMLQAGLSVTLPRDSRIAQITFTSPDPALAAKVANAYADNSIVYNLQRRFDESSYARSFLQRELDQAKRRLEDSEKAVVAYSRQNRLVDAAAGNAAAGSDGIRVLTSSNIVDINAALSRAQVARTEAEQRWHKAEASPPLSVPEVITNTAVIQLLQQRSQAQAAYDKERQSHAPDYPTMRENSAQIASLDRQTNLIANLARASLRNNYEIALAQERALKDKLESLKNQILDEQDRSIQYYILRRDVDSSRQMYDGLLQRFKEVSAAAGVAANNLSVVDRAELPRQPFSPRWRMNLASGFVAGLAFALLAVAIRSKLDDTIRTPDDVRSLGIELLGTVPTPDALTGDFDSPAFSEAFWSLRTTIDNKLVERSAQSLLLTSSRASKGKSTSGYAIARNFAKSGKNTILVDGDLRKRSLHDLIGVTNLKGFSDVLNGSADLEGAVRPTNIPGLRVLTAGSATDNSAAILAGARLSEVMLRLRTICDVVVVDGPPVLGLADAVSLAQNVSMTIFVIEADGTKSKDLVAALQRMAVNGVEMSGAILTKYDEGIHLYNY